MCTKSCKKKVRQKDSFGAPIGMTFNREPDYKTVLGGSVMILLFIILSGSLALKLVHYLIDHDFTKKESSEYIPIMKERETWTV